MLEMYWMKFAGLGLRTTDTPEIRRWKKLQNQLVLTVFILVFIVNAVGTLVNIDLMFSRLLLFLILFSLISYCHYVSWFRVGRSGLLLLFIPVYFLPNILNDIPIPHPYLSLNSLILFLLQYLMISYLLPGYGKEYRIVYISIFMGVFVCDLIYVPLLLGQGPTPAWYVAYMTDYMIFKSLFASIIIMQMFAMTFMNQLVLHLLHANSRLEANVEERIKNFVKEFQAGKKEPDQ